MNSSKMSKILYGAAFVSLAAVISIILVAKFSPINSNHVAESDKSENVKPVFSRGFSQAEWQVLVKAL